MPKKDIELDLAPLYKHMVKTASVERVLLKEAVNSSRFSQVGIGMFRDSDNGIWTLESGEDGNEYIIRAKDDEQITVELEEEQDWAANTDSTKKAITLSYKGMPICKFAATEYGFNEESAEEFADFLLSKTTDAGYVKSFIAKGTGRCPDCGQKPLHIGVKSIVCGTVGCPSQK